MRAEIIDPTAEPVPSDWEVFRKQEGLLAGWQAEALTVASWCARRPVRMGIVRDEGQIVALFVGDVSGVPRRGGAYADPSATVLTGWFDCRLLYGFTSGFAFASHLGPKDRAQALAAFEKALRQKLGRRVLGVLYRQVTDEMLPLLRKRFRPRLSSAPNTLLSNRWSDLAEYFADLPRDRRRRWQRLHQDAAESAAMIEACDIDPVQASLLAQTTRHKHGHIAPPVPAQYFRSLNGADGVRYFGHGDGDRLLAFDLAFDTGDRLVTTITGALDIGAGGRRDLYFDLYLQEIEYMISHGRGGCEFGKGMLELKQRFGCRPIPQSVVIAAW
jgi:hypothetical protein